MIKLTILMNILIKRKLNCIWCRYSTMPRLAICMVGSGPAGFYTVQGLQKMFPNATIDVYEKLPIPFGLIRFGVAPDHPEVKNAINSFNKIAAKENFSFLGNVKVGVDVSIDELKSAYHVVILCTGAEDDRQLGIEGEGLPNVLSARSFVGWYNGHPDYVNLKVNLDVESVAVLGHGNVALDVARILLKSVDELKGTDITEYALETLGKSRVKRVYLVGRRGPLHMAFTTKEFREIINLKDCDKLIELPSMVDLGPAVIQGLKPVRRRLTELMLKHAPGPICSTALKQLQLLFLRSPTHFLSTNGTLTGIRLALNQLHGDEAISGPQVQHLQCQMVIRSIGYRGAAIEPSLPFDDVRGVIANEIGRVRGVPGVYCGGWIATGPVGVIASTLDSAIFLSRLIADDINKGIVNVGVAKEGKAPIMQTLKNKKIQVVSFKDWLKIDEEEVRRGAKQNKSRVKITNLEEILEITRVMRLSVDHRRYTSCAKWYRVTLWWVFHTEV